LPISMGVHLIDEDGPVFPAMPSQVALPVAIDIKPPNHARATDRVFPYTGVDRPALPSHIPWHAYIHPHRL
jgi:hypothetical protein